MAGSASLEDRIKALKEAQSKAKKKYSADARISAEPMAELLGISWVSLRDWIKNIPSLERQGCVVGGARGIAWSFDPRKTVDALVAHFEIEQDKIIESNVELSDDYKFDVPKSERGSPLPELRVIQDMTVKGVHAKILQGKYYLADEKDEIDRIAWEAAGQAIMNAPHFVDPTGQSSPATQSALKDYLRGVAGMCFENVDKAVEATNARNEQDRNWRAN